jgi:hypothetical protein
MAKKTKQTGMVRMKPDTKLKVVEAKESLSPEPSIQEMVDHLLKVGLRHYLEEMRKP